MTTFKGEIATLEGEAKTANSEQTCLIVVKKALLILLKQNELMIDMLEKSKI